MRDFIFKHTGPMVLSAMILWPALALGQSTTLTETNWREDTHWLDLCPYISVMAGVAESVQIFTDSPWDTWGPALGARAGYQFPLGFRAELALTVLPISFATKPESTKDNYSTFAAKGRVGWGVWVDSVYFGAKIGAGLTDDLIDVTLGMDWHISDDNFYQCEFGIWSEELAGLLCGYGWSF